MFESWNGKRAIEYRRLNAIPDDWGTAVNVQQMVFGNKGESSGSGVAFSRDEITGAPEPSGDFLIDAQGEDVVSGVRNTQGLTEMARVLPDAHRELLEALTTLERHNLDMQDTEFTVEEGRLYLLQTRDAKRPAQAAVRFAVDAVGEGLLDKGGALATIEADRLDALLHPDLRSRQRVRGADARDRRLARSGEGRDRADRRRGGRARGGGRGRDPGQAIHRGRGRRRVRGGAGDPHIRGRQGLARRAGRSRNGAALHLRRVGARSSTSRRRPSASTAAASLRAI